MALFCRVSDAGSGVRGLAKHPESALFLRILFLRVNMPEITVFPVMDVTNSAELN